MFEEISDFKRAIGRLAEPRLVFLLHRGGSILRMSPDFATVLGYVEADRMSLRPLQLLDDPAHSPVLADAERCEAGETVPIRAVALRRKIGSAIPAFLVQEAVQLPDGAAILWLIALGLDAPALAEEAGELVKAQAELRLLRAALDAVPVGFMLWDEDFVCQLRNRLFETYSGFSAELLDTYKSMDEQMRFQVRRGDAARQWLDPSRFTPEQIRETPCLDAILRCQEARGRDGMMTEEEIEARLAWAKLSYGPVPRPDGVHWSIPQEFMRGDTGQALEFRSSPAPGIGWVQVVTDVTLRRQAEDKLRAANLKLEAAIAELKAAQEQLILQEKMATLGQLTAGIAHEIKNPLNFINNFSSLTADLVAELGDQLGEQKTPAIDEILTMIAKNMKIIGLHGQRTDSIVRTMLLHSRGGGVTEMALTDLVALLNDACNLAIHGARGNYPTLPINLVRHLPEGTVLARIVPQDIMRVVLNLLSNAFYAVAKRNREGGEGYQPELSLALVETGSQVEIRIRDNGVGMDEGVQAKLFTPFFTTKAPGEGTGLGLSLSYDVVVHGHNGELRVDSAPMSHTEVTIRLPRLVRSAAATIRPITMPERRGRSIG